MLVASFYKYQVALVLMVSALLIGNWIGAGDLKLLMVLTLLTSNYQDWIFALIRSLLFAGLFAFGKLLRRRENGELIAMAPFLFLGFIF